MDLTALTEDELNMHLNQVLNEQERRRRLATAPSQIAQLTAQFVADGGDRQEILQAIADD